MHGPYGIVFDAVGNLWISDHFNNRVRKVTASLLTIGPYPTMKVGKTSRPVPETMLNAGNETLVFTAPTLQQAALDPGSTTCASAAVATGALCTMGVEFAPTQVGNPVNGLVTWNTNAPNVTPLDKLFGQVLSVEPTTTLITASDNPALVGQPVTLTATVSSADTGRTGTVDFAEGTTTWCAGVQLRADGTALCTLPGLSLGTHTFTASYSGDNNNAQSQSPAFVETIKQQAALAFNVSPNPATVTGTVTLTLSAADASGTPSGNVVFYDGATALVTVALDASGTASWSSTAFAVGTHSLTAQYAGDLNNMPGTSAARSLEVDQAVTATTLTSSSSSTTVGSSLTLTASVTAQNGPAPSGSVQFFDGSASLGSAPLDGSGHATLSTSSLTPGAHTLKATYVGNTNDGTSTSAPISQTVEQIATVTTLGADVDPANAGAPVRFTAIVSMAPGANAVGTLTGAVTFMEGATTLGSAAVNSSGEAIFTTSTLAVGTHPITAQFSGDTNYAASHSTALSEVIQQTASTIALSASSSSSLAGKPASFTATVTSATGTPTGSISFRDGSAVLQTIPVNGQGIASFTSNTLPVGTHTITATYSGDSNYGNSTSTPVQQTVSLAQPNLALSGPAVAIDAGTPASFSVVLSSPGIAPTGNLTLLDGTVAIATQPVGATTFTLSSLAVGTHRIIASYGGDPNNAPTNSAPVTVTVQQGRSLTSLVSSGTPITQGQPLTLSASVTSSSSIATGFITFFDGSVALGTVPVNATGAASFSTTALGLGSHTLTAAFSGDTNHTASTSVSTSVQVVQNSSLAATSSINPSISGHVVNLTGQVTGSPTPTGTLSFFDGSTLLAALPLNASGTATLATDALAPGTHAITLRYSGDSNFSKAEAALSQVVISASTSTILLADANPATFNKPLTLTATVASNGAVATGPVVFLDGGRQLGTAPLNAAGQATLSVATLTLGQHNLSASYAGDSRANASNSTALVITVKQGTALSLTSNGNPAQTLEPIVFTATLTSAGPAVATGSITFTDGASTLGTASLDATGHATLTLPSLPAGTHHILANYAGDPVDFAAQSSDLAQQVNLRPTITTVTGTSTDLSNPQQITLIAVVHGTGSAPPSGLVTFTSGSISLGAATVDSTGVAAITVNFNTPTQQVIASYVGDAFYTSSQSSPTPITAGKPAQFTLNVSSPSLTIASHQHATVTVSLASIKGFTDDITLGCLGLPYAATCTFDKSQLKLQADGTVAATLVIDTGNPLGAGTNTSAHLDTKSSVLLCCSPAALLLFAFGRRQRRSRVPTLLALVFTLAAASACLQGCGGLQMSGTPPGTYHFKVVGTGKGSNVTQLEDVTMVVTQ